ncbi:hypothetical protein KEG38_32075 [Polyangium jinanense]|uniref:hypothetical protein n=1 Tax=Polyangium jinanense TaxID=2829994 RepID=UPI002340B1AC|nr:hypothetical protein [Polyangium jinanense]MDC3958537.1 hypothetical protein [Polyangium jinanense]
MKERERARERVMVLAEDQGLVLAPYPFPVFERWVVTSFDRRELRFEPADALSVFAERGELPRLPTVEHDLASLGGIKPAEEKLPDDPFALRRLMVDLCVEERANGMKQSAAVRLGWARKLGITATSTERERIEVEIAALDAQIEVDAKRGNEAALEALLARARRRPVDTTAMRVGDVIHVLNPKALPAKVETHPRIAVHRIDMPAPALVRLLNELDTWTEDDILDDPLLEHVIERLDPRGEERLAMLHARAQVMASRTMRVRQREGVDDWKTPLAALLAEDPPEAMLRVCFVDATPALSLCHAARRYHRRAPGPIHTLRVGPGEYSGPIRGKSKCLARLRSQQGAGSESLARSLGSISRLRRLVSGCRIGPSAIRACDR